MPAILRLQTLKNHNNKRKVKLVTKLTHTTKLYTYKSTRLKILNQLILYFFKKQTCKIYGVNVCTYLVVSGITDKNVDKQQLELYFNRAYVRIWVENNKLKYLLHMKAQN